MTQPPPAVSLATAGAIAVAPSSLGNAGSAVLALAGGMRSESLFPITADVVGDPRCFDAMSSATRLVGAALDSSVRSLEELARALGLAAGAYGVADLVAFRPEPG